jgi:Cellulase (glycosyl hydrolase family 5)
VADRAERSARWTAAQAADWQDQVGWLVGCNYVPAYASNQIEMWSADTFDAAAIDRELADAARLGFNALRVYLHDLAFAADPSGFLERVELFLGLAARHGLRVIAVIFDSVWDPSPQVGRQRAPLPGVHNSGWVQSPGVAVLREPARFAALEAYVRAVVARFREDKRIVLWDLWNEPDNPNTNSYGPYDLGTAKAGIVEPLLDLTFTWARAGGPAQPLTSGVWAGCSSGAKLGSLQRLQLDRSDVVSFHCYEGPDVMAKRISEFGRFGRPLVCTEYMARSQGSTFEAILPLLRDEGTSAISWGLHRGRTQTHLAWDTWARPCLEEPDVWFHDILWPDGRPYRQEEADLIRRLAGAAT